MKKLIIYAIVVVGTFLMWGCGKKLPPIIPAAGDLTGKIAKARDSEEPVKIDEVKNLEAVGAQDNYQSDKIATHIVNIEFVNEEQKAVINCDLEVEYKYFDKDGWRYSNARIIYNDRYTKKPEYEVSDEEILKQIMVLGYYTDGKTNAVINGPISEEQRKAVQDRFKEGEVKSIKINKKILDNKGDKYKIELEVAAQTDLFDFSGKYNAEVNLTYPGFSVTPILPVEQKITYRMLKDAIEGDYEISNVKRRFEVKFTKDGEGNLKDGALEFFEGDSSDAKGSFQVIPIFDKDSGILYLKADEWIDQPDGYTAFDLDLFFSKGDGEMKGKVIDVKNGLPCGTVQWNLK
ncbi:MAG: hypothetical protein Q8930_13075 [Bacillota bacterium]|nr:hypothetical protein [Bacillota bacterium]